MNAYRSNARTTGILFILGTAAPITAGLLLKPIMSGTDYLQKISVSQPQMTLAIFLMFIMALACTGISIAMYPVLNKYRQGLAMGAVGFRLLEGALGILSTIGYFSLLTLGRQLVNAAAPLASTLQQSAALILTVKNWISSGPVLVCWIIGAAMYYTIFYQYRLVPRWLTLWGFIGISLTFICSILFMIDPKFGTLQSILSMPILLQEMVLAVWLIVKGFALPEK